MQSPKTANQFRTRTEVEVVGITQHDRGTTGQQIGRAERLDRCLCTHWHKHGRINHPVCSMETPEAGATVRLCFEHFEHKRHTISSLSDIVSWHALRNGTEDLIRNLP